MLVAAAAGVAWGIVAFVILTPVASPALAGRRTAGGDA